MEAARSAARIAALALLLWAGMVQAAAAADVSAEFAPTLPVTIESLASEQEPDVACGAATCLSVWTGDGARLLGARVDAAGALQDERAVLIAPTASSSAVVWNGSSYLVAWTADVSGEYLVRARFVSEAGSAGPVIDVATAVSSLGEVAAAALGGTTLLAWRANAADGGSSDVRGARLGGDGTVLDPAGLNIGYGIGFQREPAIAAGGSQFLVTFSDARTGAWDIYGARVPLGGAPLDAGGVPISNATGDQTRPSAAAAGGDGFMVAWTDTRSGDKDVYAARVSTAFAVLDPAGVAISDNVGADETAGGLVHNGTSYLLAWDLPVNGGAFGSVMVASLDAAAAPTKTNVVPDTGPGTNIPRIAARGTGSAIVWCDNSSGRAVEFARLDAARSPLDVPPVTVSNGVDAHDRTAVSYDGTNYLVAWFERRSTGSTGLVRAARVAPDGTMLDPDGITLAADVPLPPAGSSVPHLAAAHASGVHLVAWQAGGDIRGARVDTAGTPLDSGGPIGIAVTGVEEKELALAGGGDDGWLVAYTSVNSTTDVMGTRISLAGAVLDGSPLAIGASAFGSEARPAVTFAGGTYHVVYYFPGSGLVRHHTVSTAGAVSSLTQVTSSGGVPLIAAASDHLLIGWTLANGSVVAGRFTLGAATIGSTQFLGVSSPRPPAMVNAGGYWVALLPLGNDMQVAYFASDLSAQARDDYSGVQDLALAAGPPGTVAVAHSRVAGEDPYLGARRAFMRTLRRHAVAASVTQNAASEGENVTFKVTLTPARSDATVTVDYQIDGGSSATEGSDFPATSGTLSFPPGTTEQFVNVPTIDDSVDEEDSETLFLEIVGATGADLDDEYGSHRASGVATIGDNDPSPNVSATDVTVDEGAGQATVTLELSAAGDRSAWVYLTGWGGTASSGDYTFPEFSVQVEFSPGQTEESVSVPIAGDAIDEPDEYFDLRLGAAHALVIADEFVRVTIADDDPVPSLSVAPASVAEGDSLTTSVPVAVSLSNPSSQTITATLSTGDGTAVAPGDYTALSGTTLTFNPGQTLKTTQVTVVSDTDDELDEAFSAVVSEPVNATISVESADMTIVDDDGPQLTVGDAIVVEGAPLEFEISLSAPTVQDVSGTCSTSDATATAGADYTARSAGFSIPAGMTGVSFAVDSLDDVLDEVDETLELTCTTSLAADLADGQATGTITDDDVPLVPPPTDGTPGAATGGTDPGGGDTGGTGTGGPADGATTTAPNVVIGARTIRVDRRGRAAVTLTCPAAPAVPACTGRLTLTTAAKVRVGGKRRKVVLGRRTFSIARGRSAKVVIRLSKKNLKLIRRLKRLRVVAASGTVRRTVGLRAPSALPRSGTHGPQ